MEHEAITINIGDHVESNREFSSDKEKSNEPLCSPPKGNLKEYKIRFDLKDKKLSRSHSFDFTLLKSVNHSNCVLNQIPILKFRANPTLTVKKPQKRVYEVWPGKNQFFFCGRCITGPKTDLIYVILVWIFFIAITLTYFIVVVPYLTQGLSGFFHFLPSFMFIATTMFFFMTSFCDPGIIPRKEIFELFGTVPEPFNSRTLDKYISANSFLSSKEKQKIERSYKYCTTCRIIRPPRTSHCSYCDNCVEVFDHHCPFIGNCIGKRNYRFFALFLVSLILYSLVLICGFIDLGLAMNNEDTFFSNKIAFYAVIGIFACGLLIIIFCILILLSYHIFLAFKGQTTREYMKNIKINNTIQQPRVNICKVDIPLINYREKIKTKKPKLQKKWNVNSNSLPNSPKQHFSKLVIIEKKTKYGRYDLSDEHIQGKILN